MHGQIVATNGIDERIFKLFNILDFYLANKISHVRLLDMVTLLDMVLVFVFAQNTLYIQIKWECFTVVFIRGSKYLLIKRKSRPYN